jgi:hypothetical protein
MNGFRHGQQTNTTNRQGNAFLSDTILDTYFTRLHGKPFYILEESSTRQRHHLGQLPGPLKMAIYAITIRYIPDVSHYWYRSFQVWLLVLKICQICRRARRLNTNRTRICAESTTGNWYWQPNNWRTSNTLIAIHGLLCLRVGQEDIHDNMYDARKFCQVNS